MLWVEDGRTCNDCAEVDECPDDQGTIILLAAWRDARCIPGMVIEPVTGEQSARSRI